MLAHEAASQTSAGAGGIRRLSTKSMTVVPVSAGSDCTTGDRRCPSRPRARAQPDQSQAKIAIGGPKADGGRRDGNGGESLGCRAWRAERDPATATPATGGPTIRYRSFDARRRGQSATSAWFVRRHDARSCRDCSWMGSPLVGQVALAARTADERARRRAARSVACHALLRRLAPGVRSGRIAVMIPGCEASTLLRPARVRVSNLPCGF